jgi:hypothetical protein
MGGDYVVYYPNDSSKQALVFEGVEIENGSAPNGVAFQLFGTIYTGRGDGAIYSVGDFIHEYGHYLQQEDKGTCYYLTEVLFGSGYATIRYYLNPSYDYYSYYTEQEASQYGQKYIDTYYSGSGYTATGLIQSY